MMQMTFLKAYPPWDSRDAMTAAMDMSSTW